MIRDCRRGAGSKVRVAAVFCGQAVTAGNEAKFEDRLSIVNVAVRIGSGPWYRVTVPLTEKLSRQILFAIAIKVRSDYCERIRSHRKGRFIRREGAVAVAQEDSHVT